MLRPYKVLITRDVFSLPKPSGHIKERILSFLEKLSIDPFQKGDYEERDTVGRPVQIKVIGSYALTFWSDHGQEEVKVIKIEKADAK